MFFDSGAKFILARASEKFGDLAPVVPASQNLGSAGSPPAKTLFHFSSPRKCTGLGTPRKCTSGRAVGPLGRGECYNSSPGRQELGREGYARHHSHTNAHHKRETPSATRILFYVCAMCDSPNFHTLFVFSISLPGISHFCFSRRAPPGLERDRMISF